jgi:hypothetical protein
MTKHQTETDLIQGVPAIHAALREQGLNWSLSQVYRRIADGTLRGAARKISHKNVVASRAALRARIAALIEGAD